MADTPDLATVIREAIAARLAEVHTSIPAVVESYSPGPPATVKVSIGLQFHRRGDEGERIAYTPPQLAAVPVLYPGAGGYSLTWPLAQGDEVLLVFGERSLSEWLANGGANKTPRHARRHSLSDPVAIPGLRSRPGKLDGEALDGDALVLRAPAGKTVKLGSASASKGVNREGDPVDAGADLATFALQVVTALGALSTGTGVPITPPSLIIVGQEIGETGTGSTRVKADD